MSDNGSNLSRRSSSQLSHESRDSKKNRTIRWPPKRAGSKTSKASLKDEDPSLTSFPSFSPEQPNKALPTVESPKLERTTSQKVRDRKATLAGLTSVSPYLNKQNALFDDSPRSSFDIPGALHLANDEQIQRLVARSGAVKLVRQYARDLAQRDAEISALRVRADNRERELKRLLRQANVASTEIERRLFKLEQDSTAQDQEQASNSRTNLDGLMGEAMASDIAASPVGNLGESESASPWDQSPFAVRPNASVKSMVTSSRHTSRASSFISETSQDPDSTVRPRAPSSIPNKGTSLQGLFQQPNNSSSYFIGGTKPPKKQKAADEASVRSAQSSRSYTWTQIWGGKASKGRGRASSVEETQPATQPQTDAESALAKLSKANSNAQVTVARSSSSMAPNTKARQVGRRTPNATRLASSPNQHARKGSNASLPLTVELDNVLEPESLPPTMAMRSSDSDGPLTDRYGFIYDQRRRKRQSLQLPKSKLNRLSATLSAGSIRSGDGSPPKEIERSATPVSMISNDEEGTKKSWQDYLKPALNVYTRPKELLSHTPSAGAVVTVSTGNIDGSATPPRPTENSLSVMTTEKGVLPSIGTVSEPQSTAVTATSSGFNDEEEHDRSADSGSSKLLLEQLNELHESLQAERMVKWNDFLRRVRAERASSADPSSKNAPEADLLDGELIGIASLGRSAKQKAKYTHFKSLVLAGIPVSLRPKVWAECSGATAQRVPGYYETLVIRSDEGNDTDPEVANQINADIRRTLTDNVFFQSGPGVRRLEEVLRAYSLHNPSIGYCQGMNLVTGSLLLICATPEDCFWLLVAVIDTILPSGYFSGSLLTARADQIVLREYVQTLLPTLSTKLDDLGVELEACTFHWFLSLYAGVLTGGEALYRIWDIVLTLHSTEAMPTFNDPSSKTLGVEFPSLHLSGPTTPVTATTPQAGDPDGERHDGTSSPFLFQIALSLLYLNQDNLLKLESPAQIYTYLNHNVVDHNVSVDALVQASEALRTKVTRKEVLDRRRAAMRTLGG